VEVLSTESIRGASQPLRDATEQCANCGAVLAGDQRYCLECGERRATVSDFLRAGPPRRASPPTAPPESHPPGAGSAAQPPRSNVVSLLAGIGVLLLAIGVGVLIGRSGSGAARAPAPQVVTIGGATGTGGAGTAEETLTSDWPSGKKGWTVQLQTLPEGAKVSAVEAAKVAASGKGAKGVGALKAEEFPSISSEGFVIYSGQYGKKAEAVKALASLKKSFPGASVIEVSGGGSPGAPSSGGGAAKSGGASNGGAGSLKKPAPAKALSGHERSSGKRYVEESAKLPDVVETGP
jgi:hypothetical protein